MKKITFYLSAVLGAALLLASCGTTKVSRVDSNTQIDLSGYWNDTDLRTVCETLIEDCLSSTRIKTSFTA